MKTESAQWRRYARIVSTDEIVEVMAYDENGTVFVSLNGQAAQLEEGQLRILSREEEAELLKSRGDG